MELIKIFSAEIGRCYIEQNLDLSEEELEECFKEDNTILEGELMWLLSQENEKIEDFNIKEIWVYGSLRKGEYNNYLFKNSKYLGKGLVRGFKMYSLGSYPFIYQTGNKDDVVIIEGYKTDEKTYNTIVLMELMHGYVKQKVKITLENGEDGNGEIYKMENLIRNCGEVESGDWVAEKLKRYLGEYIK